MLARKVRCPFVTKMMMKEDLTGASEAWQRKRSLLVGICVATLGICVVATSEDRIFLKNGW